MKFPNLEEFEFEFYDYVHNQDIENFNTLRYVGFPRLQVLKFRFEYSGHWVTVDQFLEHNGETLKEITLDHGSDLTDLAIAKFCPELRSLCFRFLGNTKTLQRILDGCQQLERIEVYCDDG